MMAKPGMVATHHWSRMKERPRAIIAPHSGSGGWAPRPIKPRPAAVRMMPAMSSVTRTISDETGRKIPFEVEEFRRHCLLHGLDDIGLTLAKCDKIAAYEAAHGLAPIKA